MSWNQILQLQTCTYMADIVFNKQVWVTAVKQGLKTAVYFWPGSEVKIDGKINHE